MMFPIRPRPESLTCAAPQVRQRRRTSSNRSNNLASLGSSKSRNKQCNNMGRVTDYIKRPIL